MKVFKFGGASIKDADSIKNVANVLRYENFKNGVVVISAMGKMTNCLEDVVNAYISSSKNLSKNIKLFTDFHENIVNNIFDKNAPIVDEIQFLFGQLSGFLIQNRSKDYDYIYDQIVSYGEIISTKIISSFLINEGINNCWIDSRKVIFTDATYRNANIIWEDTTNNCQKYFTPEKLYITQGFIAGEKYGNTTTLGREGSDYTAGIIAYCLEAESVTIWKDVDGVLNADPRVFDKTTLLTQISYKEAIEMAFYGASVIHPKTLKPLENKLIPLFVRSFKNLSKKGTSISKGTNITPNICCFVVKKNQILLSIATNDFSFIVEKNISHLFDLFDQYQLKVNLIQNSAISFFVCLEDTFNTFNQLVQSLKENFSIKYNTNVTLYTLRHFSNEDALTIEKRGAVLLKQTNKETLQIIIE